MYLSNEELGKYLKLVRESLGYSTYDVNKLCDISPSYLSLMENGKRKPSAIILKKLAPIYNIDYLDLYEKAGYIDLIDAEKAQNTRNDLLGNEVVAIPLLGIVKAGYDYLAQENWIGTVDLDKNTAESGEFFALKVKGDSMSPIFLEGDIVIIKKQNDCENNEVAVVIINGDEGTLKRVKKTEQGIILQPFNSVYGPVMFTNEEIKDKPVVIAGVFHELRRNEIKF